MMNKTMVRTLVLAVLTLASAACGDSVFGPDPTDVEFAESLGIDLAEMTETASGLYIRDGVVGTGDLAGPGDQLTVLYSGWLSDGNQFDSGEIPVILGVTNLISGFPEGLVGMQLGGERTIVIPADLAYGSQPNGPIPGDAVLVFSLELTSFVPAP